MISYIFVYNYILFDVLRYIYILSKSNKILMDEIYDCTYFESKRKGKDNKEIINGSTISLSVDFARNAFFTHKEKLLGIRVFLGNAPKR